MIRPFKHAIGLCALSVQCVAIALEVQIEVSSGAIDPPHIAINEGDVVIWRELSPVHSVVSYTGEFSSPPLTRTEPTFKYAFLRQGFYGYRLLRLEGTPPYRPFDAINNRLFTVGTVTVMPWSNAPPLVTINTPVEGSRFGATRFNPTNVVTEPIPILVSVNESFGVPARVEFYAGTNLLGIATNAPFRLLHTSAVLGTNTIIARAISKQGPVASSQQVAFTVEEAPRPKLYAPRIVRGKMFAVDYVHGPITSYGLARVDELGTYWGRENLAVNFNHSGVFVDALTNQMQFYWTFYTQP